MNVNTRKTIVFTRKTQMSADRVIRNLLSVKPIVSRVKPIVLRVKPFVLRVKPFVLRVKPFVLRVFNKLIYA